MAIGDEWPNGDFGKGIENLAMEIGQTLILSLKHQDKMLDNQQTTQQQWHVHCNHML